MKLLLCSADADKQWVARLVGKPAHDISICVINEAWVVGNTDIGILIDGLGAIKRDFGGTIHCVNMLAQSLDDVIATINKADVIWCFGGSLGWLKTVFDKTGFSKELPKMLEKKVWVGSSAGSMILGQKISDKCDQGVYLTKDPYSASEWLGILDFAIVAHVHEDYARKDALDAVMRESKTKPFPFYALSDTSAVVVDGNKTYLAGKNAQKIENGKITESI